MSINRLLLIDDDPDIGEFVRKVAEGAGYDVISTSDPATFKTSLDSFAPTVIMLDLAMPSMDGVELIRFLAERKCPARILIISGFDSKMLDAAHRLGDAHGLPMAGVVQKPVRVAELRQLLAGLSVDTAS
ncbi:MAG: response regulator [Alphaproteobacteria bacterium]|nr:response regulator [Alphaproteobacteria bacterium]MBU0796641.1 response regulator [Alphaproteobacteria bacterium]MBU0886528.1 response regulator [Alphaproteobacteria bacterium]MBU1814116.1 response regulator [Alphaproteobacteria bacterium]MBU2090991.1 response regulator [Alphaproteobacteria bacterium]